MKPDQTPPPEEKDAAELKTSGGRCASACSRIPTREDAPIVDSSWDFEDFDDEDDFTDDDDDDDCGMFPENGTWICLRIGSEPCEFCPNRALVGTAVDDSENAQAHTPAHE